MSSPEFCLGLTFAFNGLSGFIADLPIIIGNEAIVGELIYMSRTSSSG